MGSSWPRDQIWVSCIADRFLTVWATRPKDTLSANSTFSWSRNPSAWPGPGMSWKRDTLAEVGPSGLGASGCRQMGRPKASWREEEAFKLGTLSLRLKLYLHADHLRTFWKRSWCRNSHVCILPKRSWGRCSPNPFWETLPKLVHCCDFLMGRVFMTTLCLFTWGYIFVT